MEHLKDNMKFNYWLCILNRKNFEIVKEKNVWGVSKRHKNQFYKILGGAMRVIPKEDYETILKYLGESID